MSGIRRRSGSLAWPAHAKPVNLAVKHYNTRILIETMQEFKIFSPATSNGTLGPTTERITKKPLSVVLSRIKAQETVLTVDIHNAVPLL